MAETFRVLLSDSLAAQGIEVLKRFPQLQFDVKTGLKPEELAKIIAPYDALLIRSGTRVTREVIDAATSLKVIGRAGVGVDNVDIEAATRRGIVVMNSPTGNSVTTAEHAVTMMMALARHIPAADRLDPSRQMGARQIHRRRDMQQDAGRDRPRKHRPDRRRPRAWAQDESDRLRSDPDG